MPKGDIEKIVINYNPKGCVHGIKILSYDKEIVQTGDFNYMNYEIELLRGQRVVGVRSKQQTEGEAWHNNLVLIIGWME
jgi:hypothetical protein